VVLVDGWPVRGREERWRGGGGGGGCGRGERGEGDVERGDGRVRVCCGDRGWVGRGGGE